MYYKKKIRRKSVIFALVAVFVALVCCFSFFSRSSKKSVVSASADEIVSDDFWRDSYKYVNILPFPYHDALKYGEYKITNGIAFTPRANGELAFAGTSTGTAVFSLCEFYHDLGIFEIGEKYVFSSSASNYNCYMQVNVMIGGSWQCLVNLSETSSASAVIPSGVTGIMVFFAVLENSTLDTTTWCSITKQEGLAWVPPYGAFVQQGYTRGYKDGHSLGYDKGFSKGSLSNNSFLGLFTAVIDAPVQVFTNLLDVEILGYDMKQVALSLLSVALILSVLRWFTKGG